MKKEVIQRLEALPRKVALPLRHLVRCRPDKTLSSGDGS